MNGYGGEIAWEPILDANGRKCGIRAVHVGPDLHETVPSGEQCRCGVIPGLGIVRESAPNTTNDLALFAEEWERRSSNP